jgi:hypothetical protein
MFYVILRAFVSISEAPALARGADAPESDAAASPVNARASVSLAFTAPAAATGMAAVAAATSG